MFTAFLPWENALIISGALIIYFPLTVNASLRMRASFPVSDWSFILVHRLNVAYSLNAENLKDLDFEFNLLILNLFASPRWQM